MDWYPAAEATADANPVIRTEIIGPAIVKEMQK